MGADKRETGNSAGTDCKTLSQWMAGGVALTKFCSIAKTAMFYNIVLMACKENTDATLKGYTHACS